MSGTEKSSICLCSFHEDFSYRISSGAERELPQHHRAGVSEDDAGGRGQRGGHPQPVVEHPRREQHVAGCSAHAARTHPAQHHHGHAGTLVTSLPPSASQRCMYTENNLLPPMRHHEHAGSPVTVIPAQNNLIKKSALYMWRSYELVALVSKIKIAKISDLCNNISKGYMTRLS